MHTRSIYKKLARQLKKNILIRPNKSEAAKSIVYKSEPVKHVTIPDHISLKTPAHIFKVESECHKYDYPIEPILNTDFSTAFPEAKKIVLSIYRINHCQNRTEVMLPFLEYLLYKYPSSNKNTSNLFVFPFIKKKPGNIFKQANAFVKEITHYSMKPVGFLEKDQNIYIFYNLSNVLNYRIDKIKLLTKNSELWWCLIDEICNYKKVIQFPVHPSVYTLFYNNPALIYLNSNNKHIETPIAAYWGNYYRFIPIVAVLGQQATSLIPRLRAFFYYGTFRKAVRYAGWSPFYTKKISYDKTITDDDGKYTQGGIIRFALFMGKTKVILNHPKQDLQNYLHNKEEWSTHYQSLYIGKVMFDYHFYSTNPSYIAKKHQQQVPLSMHKLDMHSLKANWDPTYTGYQIT